MKLQASIVVLGLALGLCGCSSFSCNSGRRGHSREEITKYNIEQLERAIEAYVVETGSYPASLNELVRVCERLIHDVKPTEAGTLPVDGWNRAFVYKLKSSNRQESYELYSCGTNGLDEGGKGDDIILTRSAETSK